MSKSKSKRKSKRKARAGKGDSLSNSQLNASSITVSVQNTPRNPFANHPMMKKGGVHQKSKSAERAKARRETRKQARDWAGSHLLSNLFIKRSIPYIAV